MALLTNRFRLWAGAAFLSLAFAAPAGSQTAVPSTYAITNARILPVSGPAIERGTIVIRNGLIAAVGATVAVPGDARVIDGSGYTVYPGFIDAFGSLGVPSQGGGGGGAGRGGGGGGAGAQSAQGAPNSNYPPGLQPEVSVVSLLDITPDAFTGANSAGFTAALTASPTGIFRGQSAIISLGGTDVNALVIKPAVAQHIGFSAGRGGGYPNSLLGVFSALRQQLLDAQHYRDIKAAYQRNPRGMARPEFDPSLEALQPVINGSQPVVMFASNKREIERALNIAKEFNLKPIIAGGAEAPEVTPLLKAQGAAVLLSLNFPRRTSAPSPDADPDPIRVLRERVEAPKAPAKLIAAGVPFAFESGGTSWSEVIANVNRAIDNGLTADQALRALTLTPAQLLGVSDRLGTIETGKIAHLTISRGDLFNGTGRVTQLFVDGKPINIATTGAPAGRGAGPGGAAGRGAGPAMAAGTAAASAAGTWTLTVSIEGDDRSVTLSMRQEGARLIGTYQGMLGSGEMGDGTIDSDGNFRFIASITLREGTEEGTFVGTVQGNRMSGRLQIVGHEPGTFAGTRPAAPGGRGGSLQPE